MAAANAADDSSADVLAEVRQVMANDAQVQAELARQGVSQDVAVAVARQVLQERPFAAAATLREVRAAEQARHEVTQARTPWYVSVLYGLLSIGILGFLVLLGIGIAKWTGHILTLPIWPFVAGPAVLTVAGSAASAFESKDEEELTTRSVAAESIRSGFYEQLRSLVIVPAIERATRVRLIAPSADPVRVTAAPALGSRVESDRRIETESYRLVLTSLNRPGGATIGLAGTRGAGKSELLRAFCGDPADPASIENGGTIGVIIPAPVAYEAEAFLRVIVRRLAEQVPRYDARLVGKTRRSATVFESAGLLAALACIAGGLALIVKPDQTSKLVTGSLLLAIAAILIFGVLAVRTPLPRIMRQFLFLAGEPVTETFAPRHSPSAAERGPEAQANLLARRRRIGLARTAIGVVERMLYTETRSTSSQASASWNGVGLQQASGVSLGQIPLSEADLVAELADFVGQLSGGGYKVRIGIDELDKLADGDAKQFLTGLKVLFTIRDCSFLLTISEDASAQFARRGMAIRDVFDSSLDSVTIVRALTYPESRRLVQMRGAAAEADAISDTQVLLCFLLSGGLPRDLLRFCRQLGELNLSLGGDQPLSEVMALLLQSERAARIKAIELGLRSRDEQAGPAFILELETIAEVAPGEDWAATLSEFLVFDAPFAEIASSHERDQIQRLRQRQAVSYEDWIRDARRQLMCYLFFARTVLDVMNGLEGLGVAGQFYETSALATFEILADAQRRMELDPAAGWRRVVEARRAFGLCPESPAGPSAGAGASAAADGARTGADGHARSADTDHLAQDSHPAIVPLA